MNGDFEKSGTYPFTVQPAKGWKVKDHEPKYVVVVISKDTFAKINADGVTYEEVAREDATKFGTASEAAIAAGKLAVYQRKAV